MPQSMDFQGLKIPQERVLTFFKIPRSRVNQTIDGGIYRLIKII